MHDILERMCNTDMPLMINYYIKARIFTLAELNDRLRTHDFGMIDSRNIPPVISPERLKINNIEMSSSEMWVFVRHFGLIFGDMISEYDQV